MFVCILYRPLALKKKVVLIRTVKIHLVATQQELEMSKAFNATATQHKSILCTRLFDGWQEIKTSRSDRPDPLAAPLPPDHTTTDTDRAARRYPSPPPPNFLL